MRIWVEAMRIWAEQWRSTVIAETVSRVSLRDAKARAAFAVR
jgi:hypothetical protein